MSSPTFEILHGLPPYGPDAEPFTATGQGAHREGLVVRFTARNGTFWFGNFQPGLGNLTDAYAHPNGSELLVVSNGQGYVVDPADRSKRAYFGGQIESAFVLDEPSMVIFGNGLWFEAFDPSGLRWRTGRISWDGMRNIEIHSPQIRGEAWSPLEDRWMPFTIDVPTGRFVGGSFGDAAGAG